MFLREKVSKKSPRPTSFHCTAEHSSNVEHKSRFHKSSRQETDEETNRSYSSSGDEDDRPNVRKSISGVDDWALLSLVIKFYSVFSKKITNLFSQDVV